MGLFPSARNFSEVLGVTPEDQERWEKQRQAQLAKRGPSTAKQMVDQTLKDGIGLARMGLQAQMYGREAGLAERDNKRSEVTVTTSRTMYSDEMENEAYQGEDDPSLGGF